MVLRWGSVLTNIRLNHLQRELGTKSKSPGQGKDDEKGRGRLFEDSIKIMKDKQPKIAIYENVKGLTSKKHKEYFNLRIKKINPLDHLKHQRHTLIFSC